MRGWIWIVSALLSVSVGVDPARATILSFSQLTIDFTKPNEAAAKAVWSAELRVTSEGMGFDGQANSFRDGWIMTQPLAIGLSWRPADEASIELRIEPATDRFDRSAYVRYSADRSNWSDWQLLTPNRDEPSTKPTTRPSASGRVFVGEVEVPNESRVEYGALLSQYQRLDVPWASDEEAAARWIAMRDPTFFERHRPFVGYLQFLVKAKSRRGAQITRLDAVANWVLGGIYAPARDSRLEEGRDAPWRFRSDSKGK